MFYSTIRRLWPQFKALRRFVVKDLWSDRIGTLLEVTHPSGSGARVIESLCPPTKELDRVLLELGVQKQVPEWVLENYFKILVADGSASAIA
jgi:hypothetical protein